MITNKFLIALTMLLSFWASASPSIDPETYKKLMEQDICKLPYTNKAKDIRLIEEIAKLAMGDESQMSSATFRIEDLVSRDSSYYDNLSCYLQVNLTATYAYIANRNADYKASGKLYSKAALYKGLSKKESSIYKKRATQALNQYSNININSADSEKDDSKIADRESINTSSSLLKIKELTKLTSLQKNKIDQLDLSLQAQNSISKKLSERIKGLNEDNSDLQEELKNSDNQINILESNMSLGEATSSSELDLLVAEGRIKSFESRIVKLKKEMEDKDLQLEKLEMRIDRLIVSLSDSPSSIEIPANKDMSSQENLDIDTMLLIVLIILFGYVIYNGQSKVDISKVDTRNTNLVNTPNTNVIRELEGLLNGLQVEGTIKDFLFGYCQGYSSASQDNQIDSSFLMDNLIFIIFKNEDLINLKSHYRFLESEDVEQGKKIGKKDALSLKRDGKLLSLEKYLNI